MSITHEQARRLIQFNADRTLQGQDRSLLETHLEACQECRRYAESIDRLESILRPALQKRWKHQAIPHPSSMARPRRAGQLLQNVFLATRIAAMGIIGFVFLFNIWQITRSPGQGPVRPATLVQPAPTPSLVSTGTTTTSQQCSQVPYIVGKDDTLESLARAFAVPAQEIRRTNHLEDEPLAASMKLLIPVCGTLPPANRETTTTTHTPGTGTTTSTPMGIHTQ